jgi:hypothetical protein
LYAYLAKAEEIGAPLINVSRCKRLVKDISGFCNRGAVALKKTKKILDAAATRDISFQ